LRHGSAPGARRAVSPDVASALTVEMIFDSLGVRLNGPKADGKRIVVNWILPDTGESYVLTLENSALTYVAGRTADEADTTLTLTRAAMLKFMQAGAGAKALDGIKVEGDPAKVLELLALLDDFSGGFPIIEPKS